MMLRVLMLLGCFLTTALAAGSAHAAAYCQAQNTAPAPLPAALVPAAELKFGLHNATPAWVERSTVVRCMGGKLWACNMGANLPCGKANMGTTLPAGEDWCKQNPDADFIPAYITGHDSAEQWRCTNGAPAIAGPPEPTDRQGYLSNYWETLE